MNFLNKNIYFIGPNIMLKLKYNYLYGRNLVYYPDINNYYDDLLGINWSARSVYWIKQYWPRHMSNLWPTEYNLRKLRVRNVIKRNR